MVVKGKPMTIEGVVIPAGWDAEGRVVAVAISARDENEYAVARDRKGHELMRLIRKEVMVTGEVTEEAGKRTIRVRQCKARKTSGRQKLTQDNS